MFYLFAGYYQHLVSEISHSTDGIASVSKPLISGKPITRRLAKHDSFDTFFWGLLKGTIYMIYDIYDI